MGEPPYPRQRTLDKSASSIPGRLRKNSYTVGTKKACVTPCCRICSRIAAGATSRTTRVRPPTYMLCSAQLVPPTWNSGMATRLTLLRSNPNASLAVSVWAATLRWVSIAPLG